MGSEIKLIYTNMTEAEDNIENKKCCGKCACDTTPEISAEEQKKLDFYNKIVNEANRIAKIKTEYGTR